MASLAATILVAGGPTSPMWKPAKIAPRERRSAVSLGRSATGHAFATGSSSSDGCQRRLRVGDSGLTDLRGHRSGVAEPYSLGLRPLIVESLDRPPANGVRNGLRSGGYTQ